jgi:RNA polymerase sigma-70 factor (ECF subfamily)
VVAVPSRGRADLQSQAPEAGAVHALYEEYGRQIYAYCFSRLRSREEAEDAVQSTFLNAFRALQRDVAPAHESAWLYKIAENVCLTRARSSVRRRRVEAPADLEAISEVVPAHEPDAEELVNLPQALESMPEQQRRALLLREWQGLSYREIADEMDLSQSAVETLLFRARRTLASELAEDTKPRRRLARLRAGGDAGAIAALLKTLLFSGGGKAVIAGAVAASSVVGVSPGARHSIDDLLVPHMKTAAPVVHHVAKPKPVVTHYVAPPVVTHAAPPAPVRKPKPHKHATAAPPRHAKSHGRHLGEIKHGDAAAPPAPPPAETPGATAVVATPLEPAPVTTESQPQAPPGANDKDNGKGKGHDRAHHDTRPASPTPPAPVVPPVVPAPTEPRPGDNGNGTDHGNGNDRGNHGDHVRGHGRN